MKPKIANFFSLMFCSILCSCDGGANKANVEMKIAVPEAFNNNGNDYGEVSLDIKVEGRPVTPNLTVRNDAGSMFVQATIVVDDMNPSEVEIIWNHTVNGTLILLADRKFSYDPEDNQSTAFRITADQYDNESLNGSCSGKYHADSDCVSNLNEYIRNSDPLDSDDSFPKMLEIPPNGFTEESLKHCYWLGSPDDEIGQGNGESQLPVCFCKPFKLAETEVTYAQYAAFTDENPAMDRKMPLVGESYQYPVVNVSPYEAKMYNQWLLVRRPVESSEYTYRMPTEAEWEMAARASDTAMDSKPYTSGEEMTIADAHFSAGQGGGAVTVKSYPPNSWGLYDMLGNVGELTCSFSQEPDYSFEGDGKKAFECVGEDVPGKRYKTRGGSWFYDKPRARIADRGIDSPARNNDQNDTDRFEFGSSSSIGFRVAAGLIDPENSFVDCPP